MSTKVVGAYDNLESLSSLEYLVSPLQTGQPLRQTPEDFGSADARLRSEFNNSLQKLTNLVYLLARDTTGEDDKRTVLVLLQSEVAHLSVLARKAGMIRTGTEQGMETTQ